MRQLLVFFTLLALFFTLSSQGCSDKHTTIANGVEYTLVEKNKGKKYHSSWNKFNRLLEQERYKDAQLLVKEIYANAWRTKNHPEQLRCLSAELLLLEQTTEDSMLEQYQLLSSYEAASAYPLKNIVRLEKIQFLRDNYRGWGPKSEDDQEVDVRLWNRERFKKEMTRLGDLALNDHTDALKNTRLLDYKIAFEHTTYEASLFPSLYHYVAMRLLQFYDLKCFESKLDLSDAERQLLLMDYSSFSQLDLTKLQLDQANGIKVLDLYQSIIRFSMERKEDYAAEWFNLYRITEGGSYRYSYSSDNYWNKVAQLAEQSSYKPIRLEIKRMILERDFTRFEEQKVKTKADYEVFLKRVEELENERKLFRYLPSTLTIREQILQQEIELEVVNQNAVGRPILGLITARNVEDFTYFIYPKGDKAIEELSKTDAIRTVNVRLHKWDDYQSHAVEFFIDSLPLGAYYLVLDKQRNDHFVFTSFIVTNYSVSAVGPSIYFTDFVTGRPLSQKSVTFYKETWNKESKAYEMLQAEQAITDENGSVKQFQNYFEFNGLRQAVPSGSYYYSRSDDNQKSATVVLDIYTDRAIYRPGQKVFFKTLFKAYNSAFKGKVLMDEKAVVTLKDANGQTVSSKEIKSNSFGSAEGYFDLPKGGLLGRYSLTVKRGDDSNTIYFAVNEYKRPKILMEWQKPTQALKMDQNEVLVGVLKTYAGVPLVNRVVNYSVNEELYHDYRSDEDHIDLPLISYSGSVETDANGLFTIPIDAIEIGSRKMIDYAIYAEVIDIGGEYVSAQYELHLTKADFSVSVDTKSTWLGDEGLFTVNTKASNGVVIPTTGDYTLYQLVAKNKTPFVREWSRPASALFSEVAFKKWYPYLPYAGRESLMDTVKVMGGIWKTNESISLFLKELAAGNYLLVTHAVDSKKNNIRQTTEVRITKDGVNTDVALYLQTDVVRNKVDDVMLQFELFSLLKDASVLVEYYDQERLLLVQTMRLQGDRDLINYAVPPLRSDRLDVRVSVLQNGQLFTATTHFIPSVAIPELQVEWISFRDRIQPNSKEKWKLKVTDKAGKPVQAEVLVAMYDQSLETFANHFYTWQKSYDSNDMPPRVIHSSVDQLYWKSHFAGSPFLKALLDFMPKLIYSVESGNGLQSAEGGYALRTKGVSTNDVMVAQYAPMSDMEEEEIIVPEDSAVPEESVTKIAVVKSDNFRENLQETAFFLPQLETNANGEVILSFSAPEALTKWRVLGLAHTKDLGYLKFERSTVTQKDLMVEVLVPRFVREGDALSLSARISNTTASVLNASVELELFDLSTQQGLNLPFEVKQEVKSISVPSNGSEVVEWWVIVPYQLSNVGVRVRAKAGSISDGEQMILPILSNKTLVTAALPFVIDQSGNRVIDYSSILPKGDVSQLKVTLDYVQNPMWHVLMALPNMDVKEEKETVPLSNRLVALAAMDQILKKNPGIVSVVNQWKVKGADALLSELDRNAELKAIILAETPWIVQAQSQEERKRYLAELLTAVDAVSEGKNIWNKLAAGISYDKDYRGWPWRLGMACNVGISRTILLNLERVRQLNPTFYQSVVNPLVVNDVMGYVMAMKWQYFKGLSQEQQSKQEDIQLVYLTLCFPSDFSKYSSMLKILEVNAIKDWNKRTLNEQVLVAMIADRKKETKTKAAIIEGVKQRVIKTKDSGYFWPAYKNSQGTNIGSVALQAAVISLLATDTTSAELVRQAQLWLLLNKRSNDWGDNYTTTEAIYGLLQSSDWSSRPIEDVIKQNGKLLIIPKLEAGSGYFTIGLQPKFMSLTIDKKGSLPSFGTVFTQYLVDVDKVKANQTGLQIRKTLYKVTRDASGKEIKTKLSDGAKLTQGEKIYVELKLTVDQSLEFLQIKDYRAAGLEPLEQSSGYVYQNGVGAYKEVRDASISYSIEQLDRGVYIFGYELSVSRKGNYSNGYVMVQSAFNPELVSYGKGTRLEIK